MNILYRWFPGIALISCLLTQIVIPPVTAQPAGTACYDEKTTIFGQKQTPASAARIYDVHRYDLDLTIRPEPFFLQGSVAISLVLPAATLELVSFDLEGLEVDSVFQDGSPVSYSRSSTELIITPLSIMAPGDSGIFTIYYQGIPQTGLHRRFNTAGDTVIYSHNEPYDAHFWFPCNDDPDDKATLKLSARLPSSYTVIGNGRLLGIYPDTQNRQRTVWEENYPVATYLISLAAAPYRIVGRDWLFDTVSMPVYYYVYPADSSRGSRTVDATCSMLSFYSQYIGIYPFPGDKYAMVEVPMTEATAMENQTATTMRDLAMDNLEVVAHELAHQWWGNALTPVTFADIWLNEGFASYFDALYTESYAGASAFAGRMNQYKTLIFQDGSNAYPVYDPPVQYWFGRSVYYKGAWILHMLRCTMGDDLFRTICREYFSRYEYKNVTTADFIQICEAISETSWQSYFDQWLNYGGMPELNLDWQQNGQNLVITLQQLQPGIVYNLDLEVLIQGLFKDTLISVSCSDAYNEYQLLFADQVQTVTLDPAKKVLQINNSPVYYQARGTALLNIFPNPLVEHASILYRTDRSRHLLLEIWNILGERVMILMDEKQSSGLHRYNWDKINLAAGTYFCVLHDEDKIEVKKIVILR